MAPMNNPSRNPRVEVEPLRGRLRHEHRTMEAMLRIWCRAEGHDCAPRARLCPECREFLAYAERRLAKCPYGEAKPTCATCPVHCYKADPREHARVVMRFAGPRMVWRHPWLSLMHLVDKLRKVEHPMVERRRRKRCS